MAKVSEVKWGFGSKDMGQFHVESFNLFEEEDADAYAALRTRAQDKSEGIHIEQIREYSRKTQEVREDQDAGSRTTTTTEEIVVVVHYWVKKPQKTKGDTDEDVQEARRDWAGQRSAGE